MARDTLIDFFRDLARASGEFLVHDDGFRSRTYSYTEVARAAEAFALRLHATGLQKGDHIIFWSENRPEWIVAFWGCLLDGLVVVPVDYRASVEFLGRVAGIVKARLVLVGQDVDLPAGKVEVPVWRLHDLRWADSPPPTVDLRVDITKDDIVEIIFTSGATAEPKGVVITHRNILANIVPVEQEVIKYRKWGRPFFPLRFLNLLPLSHMFGQAMATFIPPLLPGVVVFMQSYNPADIIEQLKSRRVSVLVSVPKILDVLRGHILRIVPQAAEKAPHRHWISRWWHFRAVHRRLGFKFWCFVVGAAPLESALEAFWSELGFVVVQGYGLTETAPIVSLNHPFGTRKGSVGKAIPGVELKIAPDGEILVKGENVTRGYFNAPDLAADTFDEGWFHTGDIGEMEADGQLYVRGRKKEVIVTPEGLNVFPEDVERILNQTPGVRDSAVVGALVDGEERVSAVLILAPGVDPDDVVRRANLQLEDHQKIRRALAWPARELPRTEGTRKLKRAAIGAWVRTGAPPQAVAPGADELTSLVAKYAKRGNLSAATTIDELGLSSLERVDLMVALEEKFQTRVDEGAFAEARDLGQLRALIEGSGAGTLAPSEPIDFPAWNRSWWARAIRRVSLPTWILPMARVFAWIRVEGVEALNDLSGPAVFAANHQSYMDGPVILAALPARWRYRTGPAMAKEFFKAHFFPREHTLWARITNSLNYYLAALFFSAFPLPQQEAGTHQTLRYMGDVADDGFSILIFPEGRMTDTGEIASFRPGVGMIGSRLGIPIVPVRLEGLDKVLHRNWHMARPGRVRVAFGRPMRLSGDDYAELARQVEDAVRRL